MLNVRAFPPPRWRSVVTLRVFGVEVKVFTSPLARNHSKRGMTFKSSIRSNQKVRISKVSGSSAPDVLFTLALTHRFSSGVFILTHPNQLLGNCCRSCRKSDDLITIFMIVLRGDEKAQCVSRSKKKLLKLKKKDSPLSFWPLKRSSFLLYPAQNHCKEKWLNVWLLCVCVHFFYIQWISFIHLQQRLLAEGVVKSATFYAMTHGEFRVNRSVI